MTHRSHRSGGRRPRLVVPGAVLLVVAACSSGSTGPSASAGPAGSSGRSGDVTVKLTTVADMDAPTQLQPRPGSGVLYVTQRAGQVRRLARQGDTYTVVKAPVLDVSSLVNTDGEMGLLGLAFSADGRQLFVDYNTKDRTTHLLRFPIDDQGNADEKGATELLAVDQPFGNHKGGNLHFGPDGYLYFGLGDGGSQNDPDQRAGNTNDLHGKILRIDPSKRSGSKPYSIPADNPFAGGGGRPEIYLYGVRNPWRFSFDRRTDDLWIADVGQNDVEEVDHLPKGTGLGKDLGWSGLEGTRRNIPGRIRPGTVPPVFEYIHDDGGCSITGGVVYRGRKIPKLEGTYLFSDYCQPDLRGLRLSPEGKVTERKLGVALDQTVSIDEDSSGEVFLLGANQISRLDPA